jgi:biopolymer transport protein ExbD
MAEPEASLMKLKTTPKPPPMIPTGSMADIAFLLIIFFMVTTVFEVDRTSVNLPTAQIREEAEKGAAYVVLAKKDDKLVYKFSNGEDNTHPVGGPNDIYLEASRMTYGREKDPQQFVLKAEGTVHFEKIDELLEAMRKGGVQRVLLLTAQGGGDE